MSHDLTRADNFGAGPAALPLEVLQKAQDELTNFRGTGMSVMEISHRHKLYEQVHYGAEERLRKLLGISDNHQVLFLQGGASLQFAMLPMNFLTAGKAASYVMTGAWAGKAFEEAAKLGDARKTADFKAEGYKRIPSASELTWNEDDAYLHITSNETIGGTQWMSFPDTGAVPLVADMSSDILSRELPVEKFAMIYAGAQKNLGPSGVTVVIMRQDFLDKSSTSVPTMLRYDVHAKNRSLYNTPPTFAIYLLGLVLEWVEEKGGVAAIEKANEHKAKLLYDAIDGSAGFYRGHAEVASRSRMNVTFRVASEELEQKFLAEAKEKGFVGLNGHRSVGGCRASIYNAVPVEACERLADFMTEFRQRNS